MFEGCGQPRKAADCVRTQGCTCAQAGLHWSRVLTLRLGPQVKLVGSTISCEPAWEGADTAKTRRQNPHVQSYVMATDQVHCVHGPRPAVWNRPSIGLLECSGRACWTCLSSSRSSSCLPSLHEGDND